MKAGGTAAAPSAGQTPVAGPPVAAPSAGIPGAVAPTGAGGGTPPPLSINDAEQIRAKALEEAKAEFKEQIQAQEERFQAEKAELLRAAAANASIKSDAAMVTSEEGAASSPDLDAAMDFENVQQAKDALLKERRKPVEKWG